MKKFLLLSAALLLACVSCKKTEEPSNTVLKLNHNSVALNQDGEITAQLSVIEPSQYASSKLVSWVSDNSCVKVDPKTGVVTAISPGKANVFAFIDGLDGARGSCLVTVNAVTTATIELTVPKTTLNLGESMYIKYVYSESVAGKQIAMSSSDTIGKKLISYKAHNNVDSVLVVGIAAGQVRFTIANAYNKNVSKGVDLTVIETPIESFSFSSTFNDLKIGESDTLKTEILPLAAKSTPVKWSSSDASVVAVDAKGIVTGVSKGTAVIYAATSFSTILSHTITINDPSAKKFAFEAKTMTVNIGLGTELLYPVNFKLDPTIAQNPTVTVIASYAPEKGVKSDIQVAKLSNGMVVVYAPHTLSTIGSAALMAQNGSTDKDGKLITDTCIVSAANFSPNVLVAKAVYTGIDFGAKIAPVAKFISFLNEPITVKKVQLIKTGETETIVESINVDETINSALTVKSFVFAPLICSIAQVSGYVVRYTIELSGVESTFDRSLVVDNGQALVKGVQ